LSTWRADEQAERIDWMTCRPVQVDVIERLNEDGVCRVSRGITFIRVVGWATNPHTCGMGNAVPGEERYARATPPRIHSSLMFLSPPPPPPPPLPRVATRSAAIASVV
jgi:hypothetical protein